ncbi:dihydrofolate reductase family protein [Phycicoccus sonneratiae]|uniref:Dihydrofolate reductase family protein n=1 Tax=Phycicoccus sonneratiae TaxID=2807628 RepID=A0ABS2CHB6_9MICO|nr:dihydrofolate reductase family protein [Phycicoccus sonneraticus]MBM6399262.1 dihydrofolate reductase family protein [Phycicoccus sonneraticus]
MRTLAVTENITLDGRIDMVGDWFDSQSDDPGLRAENTRQMAAADAPLVGRETFEAFRGYWRDLDDDTTGVSAYLNRVEKHVVSSTLTDPDWAGTTVLGADWLDRVAALRGGEGGDIVCTGSVTLVHALVGAGLVDEFRLFQYPVVQGEGRRLFPDGHTARGLALADSTVFAGGGGHQRWVVTR